MAIIKATHPLNNKTTDRMIKEIDLYCIYDRLQGYTPGIPFYSDDLAKRWFKTKMETDPTLIHSPEDYELHKIGTFHTDTGKVDNLNGETLIEKGVNYASRKD